MPLALRIAVGLALLVALVTGIAFHQAATVGRLAEESRRLGEVGFGTLRSVHRLEVTIDRLLERSRKLAVLRDRGFGDAVEKDRELVGRFLRELEARPLSPGEEDALAGLLAGWRRYADAAPPAERSAMGGRGKVLVELLESSLAPLGSHLEQLRGATRATMAEVVADHRRRAADAERAARWAAAGAVLLAALVAVLVILPPARALRRLHRATGELAAGRLEHRVEPAGGPELAELAESFNAMAARLLELDRLKRDFVSAVSHDLKAPLASLEETARLLLDGLPGPLEPKQRRLLELQLASCRKLSRMISDLLDRARLDAGAWDWEMERRDLAELAREAVEDVRGRAAERGLELEVEAAAPAEVTCDRPAVARVLANLLANAVELTPRGGSVGVEVRRLGAAEFPPPVRRLGPPPATEGVLVEVCDTGPGVPEADRERIFQRFQRGRPGGSGLGLSIARTIVEAHGGALWVEDRAGGGASFRFFLWSGPAPTAAGAGAGADTTSPGRPAGGGEAE